jgi:hypothetical protein
MNITEREYDRRIAELAAESADRGELNAKLNGLLFTLARLVDSGDLDRAREMARETIEAFAWREEMGDATP